MSFLHQNIVNTEGMFEGAEAGGYAIGAFNFSTFETLKAIFRAAQEVKIPFILQVTESSIEYFGINCLTSIVKSMAEGCETQFALHLDHGSSFEICKTCIENGFSSVMIDKSNLPIERNIEETRSVAEYARKYYVSVEGELGSLEGSEDNMDVTKSFLTDPNEALEFVSESKVNSLAVSIGTKHGAYKSSSGTPKLAIERLKQIRENLNGFPLVLHGASSLPQDMINKCNECGACIKGARGIPEHEIAEAISKGIRKVNIDTDIRLAFLSGIMKSLIENCENIDMRKHNKCGIEHAALEISKKMLFLSKKTI